MPPDINALERATQVARVLSASLPAAVDPATVSTKAKIPFKALLLRELLLYRIAEVSNAACELFHDHRLIGATILTRACLEAVAWLFVVDRRIQKCLDAKALGTFPDFIDRVVLGSRQPDAEHQAYNVLNAINELDEAIPGFRHAYDTCSEFAHPNADGLIGSYGRFDPKTFLFNLDPKKYQVPVDGIVPFLAAGLELFLHVYERMPDRLLEFAKLCEAELESH